MKQLALGLLALVVLCLAMGSPAWAQDETTIVVESKKVEQGEVTDLAITIQDMPSSGIRELRVQNEGLTYDPRVFILDNIFDNRPFRLQDSFINNGTGTASFTLLDSGQNVLQDVVVATLRINPVGSDGSMTRIDLNAELIDQNGNTVPHTVRPGFVKIGGENQPPNADAGRDRITGVGRQINLDASGSSDPDDDPLLFEWTTASRPSDGQAGLTDTDTANPSFTPDGTGRYVFEVTVDDRFGGTDTDQVEVLVTDQEILLTLGELIALIESIDFSEECQSAKETFLSQLSVVQEALVNENFDQALEPLQRFVDEVEAQRGQCLTEGQADEILQLANELLELLADRTVDRGDVDGDGQVTILDARRAWEFAQGDIELGTVAQRAADVTDDGQVTRADADRIAQMAVESSQASALDAWTPQVQTQSSWNGYRFNVQGSAVRSVQLRVFNLQGRSVYASGWTPGKRLSWTLRNDWGERVANGVYLAIVRVQDVWGNVQSSEIRRIMVLR